MGSWNKSWKGFTVNERLPGAFVDVAVWDVFNSVAQLYRPAQIKKAALLNFGRLQDDFKVV